MKYLVLLLVLVFLVYGVLFANSTHREDRHALGSSENAVINYIGCAVCGFYVLASHIWEGLKTIYKDAREDLR